MVKKPEIKLARFELEVMEVVWRLGRASVREVQESLPSDRQSAYTTVQTVVNRLEQKGALRRASKEGKANVFEPCIAREGAYRRLCDDFLSLVGGSAQPLTSYLVESGKLTLADLREMEKALKTIDGNRRKKGE
jgi:BlaI family penicillinase repressor